MSGKLHLRLPLSLVPFYYSFVTPKSTETPQGELVKDQVL